ncbi:hypothetical protein GCM10025863_33060 [Microbacterium suwonense]|uniref:Protein-glutamine gamma-glutamyltransferase TgpA N-terminal domain-containing protein n=1 Tax=Microbacterium suwonense TaxID=683047 RepID=A0ABM8FNW8_9MICO|nr:hypothetical protein GCM10025863_00420 [Microbacterium suwonense]BDZ40692.1 hypothetical protein GCM10025863_33060 [Microbacterium suwonense]
MTDRAQAAGAIQSPPRRPAGPLGSGMLAMLTVIVAVWPYTGAVQPGLWSFVVGVTVILVALVGMIARGALGGVRIGIRRVLVLLAQLIVAVLACTAMLAGETARLGMIPTGQTVRLIGVRLTQSFDEIMNGVAPIAASMPMATLLGLAFAVVAILIDQLVAHRLVVLAVLLSSVVGVVPMLVSFGTVNIAWFLMQAVTILLLLRFGARHDPRAARSASSTVATTVGAVAIVAALVLAPVLPVASALPGTGPMLTVSANLRLGDDLRRPEGVEALTLVTSAASAPYLRMATLSRFDGDVWRPDRGDRVPVRAGFGERDWADPIATVTNDVSIRVVGVSSDRLPVPYAPERLTGLEGLVGGAREPHRAQSHRGRGRVGLHGEGRHRRADPGADSGVDGIRRTDTRAARRPSADHRSAGERGDRGRRHRLRPADRPAGLVPHRVLVLAGGPGRGGVRRHGRRGRGDLPGQAHRVLHPLRGRVRADDVDARDAGADRRRLSARHRHG